MGWLIRIPCFPAKMGALCPVPATVQHLEIAVRRDRKRVVEVATVEVLMTIMHGGSMDKRKSGILNSLGMMKDCMKDQIMRCRIRGMRVCTINSEAKQRLVIL